MSIYHETNQCPLEEKRGEDKFVAFSDQLGLKNELIFTANQVCLSGTIQIFLELARSLVSSRLDRRTTKSLS